MERPRTRREPRAHALPRPSRVVAAWLLVALVAPRPLHAKPGRVPLRAGPWGTIDRVEIVLQPPPAVFGDLDCGPPAPPWRFRDYSRAQLDSLFTRAGVDGPRRAALLGGAACTAGGCELTPDLDALLTLRESERARIYEALAAFPENAHAFLPFSIPVEHA